ncbi:MAG: metalloregulator ArsR/SmtB family transcription factor [Candidatus Fermentibacteraceae bacterium]
MDEARLADAMKALASETRLRILALLGRHPLCAGGIARKAGISPSAASQHLRILRSAGLVEDCRCGSHVHYSLVKERLREMEAGLETLLRIREEAPCRKPDGECESMQTDDR